MLIGKSLALIPVIKEAYIYKESIDSTVWICIKVEKYIYKKDITLLYFRIEIKGICIHGYSVHCTIYNYIIIMFLFL